MPTSTTEPAGPTSGGSTAAPHTPPRRARGWARRAGIALVVVAALIGVTSVWNTFAGPPGVGHFRSVEARARYVEAYTTAMSALPTPSATHDVRTDLGVVRVYEWAPTATASAATTDPAAPSAPDEDNTPDGDAAPTTDPTADAATVLLLPGRTSGVPMWVENLPSLLGEHRILALDALGDSGLSVQSAPIADLDMQARWIDQVIAELAPGGVHLVGHSFGGATAATYAVRYPEQVRTLTLLDPVFTIAYPPAGMMGWAMLSSLPGIPASLREHALGKVGGGEFDGEDPMARMIEAGTDGFSASLPTPAPLTEDEAALLTMPVYLALAERDSFAGGADTAEIAQRLLQHATVKTWPGTTHSLPMQVADEIAPVLKNHWNQVP